MNFARFCMPNIFDNVPHGIYFDVDMIVQSSVSILMDEYYDTHDYMAWSVKNRAMYRSIKHNKEKAAFLNNHLNHNLSAIYPSVVKKPLDFSAVDHIFNAGFLMFNLDIWRENNFTQQSIALYEFNKIYTNQFGKK